MLSRGFTGTIKMSRSYGIAKADLIFVLLTLATLYCFRKYDITVLFEQAVKGLL
jgi:hypothetical protein